MYWHLGCDKVKLGVPFQLSFALNIFILVLPASTMAEKDVEAQVASGNNKFTLDMFKVLSKKGGNVFFSPISAHACLSMAYQGAAGTTHDKFANTLHVPNKALAAEGYSTILDTLNNIEGVTLLMANKVFLMKGHKLQASFENAMTKKFRSEVQFLNFCNSEESAGAINKWVEEKTKEKIRDLFEKDAFDGDTRLVLVNAIYFKGDWALKFDKEATRTEPFYVDESTTIDCQMMHKKDNYYIKYVEDLKAQILQIPYKNENVSMFIILPEEKNGITEVESKLVGMDIDDLLKDFYKREIHLAMPKFKIEVKMDLRDTLKKMGLGEIFDSSSCNLSELIESGEKLYVDQVIQKAFIEVNEEGSEAAAATGLVAVLCCYIPPTYFYVNHPFIVFIRVEGKSNNVLFFGRVTEPVSGDSMVGPRGEPPEPEEPLILHPVQEFE